MASQFGRAPRRQCRLGHFSAGVDCPYGTLPIFRTHLRFGRISSDLRPVALFHSDRKETKCGAKVGRRCYFERVASVFTSVESTLSSGHHKNRGGRYADGAFRQHRHCVFPQGHSRPGVQKAAFANQLRAVDAPAESPWPLSRKHAGADEASARCAISGESPRMFGSTG